MLEVACQTLECSIVSRKLSSFVRCSFMFFPHLFFRHISQQNHGNMHMKNAPIWRYRNSWCSHQSWIIDTKSTLFMVHDWQDSHWMLVTLPENGPLEKEILLETIIFWGELLVLGSVLQQIHQHLRAGEDHFNDPSHRLDCSDFVELLGGFGAFGRVEGKLHPWN